MKQLFFSCDICEIYLEDGNYWFHDATDKTIPPYRVKVVAIFEWDTEYFELPPFNCDLCIPCVFYVEGEIDGMYRIVFLDMVEEGE